MHSKSPLLYACLRGEQRVTALAATVGILGVVILGLSIGNHTSASGAENHIPVGALDVSLAMRHHPPLSAQGETAPQTGPFQRLEGPRHPAIRPIDIPINQSIVVESRQVSTLLPRPVMMPVETEWVRGVDVSRLSPEKVEEILAKASALKDIAPFAPGSGPNSNERMSEWLASDRAVVQGTPRAYAVLMLVNYGWGLDQWPYLDRMWWHESGWDPQTVDQQQGNDYGELDPTKTWGIPQANPASKMASAGDDWATNPETQIRWGLSYILSSYGSPEKAFEAWRKRAATGSYGWY